MDCNNYISLDIDKEDIKIETTRGTGNGGQHKNTTDSCVVLTHKATGIKVVRDGRSQHRNKEDALEELKIRLNEFYMSKFSKEKSIKRRDQIGNGNRGSDKNRTYNQKLDIVIDHKTNKKTSLKNFIKGKIELLK